MLLSIEVSLYCPRFVVMDVADGKVELIHTAMNDHLCDASKAQRNRTPVSQLLMEIAEKLEFVLTAYPITDAVWGMRQLGIANADAAKTALGAILLVLAQHDVSADEMLRSRMHLLLTGKSKADAGLLHDQLLQLQPADESYATPLLNALAWFKLRQLIH